MVGIPAVTTLSSEARNCGRLRTAGLEAATSGSSALSVVCSPAKVVVARRRVLGSSESASSRLWLWLAMAPVAVLVLAISSVSCWLREARAPSALAPCTTSWSKVGWSRVSSAVSWLVVCRPGARYFSAWLASTPRPCSEAASPRMKPLSPARVSGSKVSNSWSMLTSE